MANRNRVLIVDDEENMRELLDIVLSNEGYEIETVPNVEDAMDAISRKQFDVLLTDLRIGAERNAGMRLLSWVQENAATIPAIMITAHGSVETAIEAMKLGAADYVMKPFKNDEIRLVVARALEARDLKRENVALRKEQASRGKIDDIVGTSRPVQELLTMIRRVATLPSTVAITGESGTGKELVARAIHQLSDRADKPFVAINCGGIPENLLESELFGHKKGAFTGAVEDKEGLFVTADGGTLFLDEIGEMPLALQVKLLRVLSDSIITPVGGVSGTKVDVRLISATNRNLEEMVKTNAFREDLYYRLNVIPIQVPPLRDREDDIPLLARHFVRKAGAKLGRADLRISPEVEKTLGAFDWPGNVRELENVIERAVALCNDTTIEVTDLPPSVQNPQREPTDVVMELPRAGLDLEHLIADIETQLIREALDRAHHSQKHAAKLLGLTPRSLRYRLQKYEIE